jgi:phosphopantothenate synthetase
MTKLLSLALAALVTTATVASAASPTADASGQVFHRDLHEDRSIRDGLVEFSRVDAPAAGVIEIYDYRLGEMGRLVASEAVDAGTNWQVSIYTGAKLQGDALAVLKVDGQAVAQRVLVNTN